MMPLVVDATRATFSIELYRGRESLWIQPQHKRDWSEDRIYRRDGIGAKLLDQENLAAEFRRRSYSEEAIGKIPSGNLLRVIRAVLPKN